MTIEVVNFTRSRVDELYFVQVGVLVLKKLGWPKNAEISLVFVGDARMRTLNKKYRGLNKTTDVLSFDYQDKKNPPRPSFEKGGERRGILGEIVISVPRARKQAKEQSYPLKRELLALFLHGILHLAGYEDETEKGYKKMMDKQEKLLGSLSF